jgi:hypothetical protein
MGSLWEREEADNINQLITISKSTYTNNLFTFINIITDHIMQLLLSQRQFLYCVKICESCEVKM